jgi:hypothetical protein
MAAGHYAVLALTEIVGLLVAGAGVVAQGPHTADAAPPSGGEQVKAEQPPFAKEAGAEKPA